MGKSKEIKDAEKVAAKLKKTCDMLMEYPKEQLANLLACKMVLEQ
jgi:hypothetical protein